MRVKQRPLWMDLVVLAAFCAVMFFLGLGAIGLTGADEPRYAQIAREMLARHDWVVPVLGGKPWLEKPVLYYWQAMIAYRVFGVSDWAARLPSAVDATALVAAVYFFVRRFRGMALDAALITASCVSVIVFAHGASTDMPLAGTFAVAMLCWLAWWLGERVETDELRPIRPDVSAKDVPPKSGSRLLLSGFYLFLALATLAKGPVAPLLAGMVIVAFARVQRNFATVWRTLWMPGVVLYAAVSAPWYVLVQLRTGNFFRVFILEHNLERFATTVHRHPQPFWFFTVVILAALLPWTTLAVAGFARGLRALVLSRAPLAPDRGGASSNRAGDVFLALWGALPVIFFSLSGSKLPGYILPAVPAFSLLAAGYLRRGLLRGGLLNRALLWSHALCTGGTFASALLAPALLLRVMPSQAAVLWAVIAGVVVAALVMASVHRVGLRSLRLITVLPVAMGLVFLLRVAAPALGETVSARGVAHELARLAPPAVPVAVLGTHRELDYGLGFYRSQPVARYSASEVPRGAHVLIAGGNPQDLSRYLDGRQFALLGELPKNNLKFYWVAAQ
jgi:4-amino-4-deoxy-L-arabinose transferase-like glycosyltransferase